MELEKFYKGKKVFVTGHTGFKGSWLCWVLKQWGAEVTGYALPPEDKRGSLFNLTNLGESLHSHLDDINNLTALKEALINSQATIVFHLAAQPLVVESYHTPVDTYLTNLMGTVNMLEAIRESQDVESAVIITTDKCYENKESLNPYVESDRLGGHDVYSSSKAMAELAVTSYYKSFLKEKGVGIATARAGNIIGGGDFCEYRLIPDIFEAIAKNNKMVLRYPRAVRPWQYVLDALYGYLILGAKLSHDKTKFSTSFNFSPEHDKNEVYNVEYIAKKFMSMFGKTEYVINEEAAKVHEATLLLLDSTKARNMLNWQSVLNIERGISFTADWYKLYLEEKDPVDITMMQIKEYFKLVKSRVTE